MQLLFVVHVLFVSGSSLVINISENYYRLYIQTRPSITTKSSLGINIKARSYDKFKLICEQRKFRKNNAA